MMTAWPNWNVIEARRNQGDFDFEVQNNPVGGERR